MKVLVLGDDGRAHAFVWKLFNSHQTKEVLCAPGNGGTSQLAPMVDISPTNPAEITRWMFEEQIDLVVPSSSDALRAGLVDEMLGLHIEVCGPPANSTQIEQSRCYAKDFLLRHDLPTAPGRTFTSLKTAERYLAAQSLPVVVKSDNPEAGSGVFEDRYTALTALRDFFEARPVIGSNDGVVIESFLPGKRVCISALTDGETVLPFLPTRVYDRLHEDDTGPVAPSMGAHTSTSLYARKLTDYMQRHLMQPIISALEKEQLPYRGIIGIDCIVTDRGPRMTGLRCAMRDIEAQVVLPRLEDDFVSILQASIRKRLSEFGTLHWRDESSVGLTLVAQGYPNHFPKDTPIEGLADVDEGVLSFHHETYNPLGLRYNPSALGGAAIMSGGVVVLTTTGGHVLTVVALAATLNGARGKAVINAERIRFAGRHFRGDIGRQEFA